MVTIDPTTFLSAASINTNGLQGTIVSWDRVQLVQ
jgi:hypothetical protein